MSELTAALASEIAAGCRQGSREIAQALSRAFEAAIELTVGEPAPFDIAAAVDLDGPGLVIALEVESRGALAVLAESCGFIPLSRESLNATGQSKLATLAQELGELLLPSACPAKETRALLVSSVRDALTKAQPASDALSLSLDLTSGERKGALRLIWPVAQPLAAVRTEAQAWTGMRSVSSASATAAEVHQDDELSRLPLYTRSLLRIRVPVHVTLAEKRQSVESIVRLGPGSLIQFDKSCEQTLDLEVDSQPIAQGEAVKIGDKFGLRITSITMPAERFHKVTTNQRDS